MIQPGTILPPLIGYALLFNRPSNRRKNGRRLLFKPFAFDVFLATSNSDVFGVINHEDQSVMFASWKRGSLLIDSDDVGLFVIALPRNDGYGRTAIKLVSGGHATSMSACVCNYPQYTRRDDATDIVYRASLVEVSGVANPAIKGTSLRVGASADVPRTIEELLAEDCRLRRANLAHTQSGTLAEWKRRKATERASLLRTIDHNNQLAAV